MRSFPINLIRVIDGDTIIAAIDLGLDLWMHNRRCRLARINSPEMNTPLGVAAREWLVNRLNLLGPGSVPTLLMAHCYRPDDYGRLLIDLMDGEKCINDELVRTGHAVYVARGEESE